MKRVVVTGATGFVGKALVEEFLRRGYKVSAWVRRLPDASMKVSGADYVEIDDFEGNVTFPDMTDVDTVVHCAGRAHVAESHSADSMKTYRLINSHMTRRLAELAAESDVKRFIFMSTVKVNGDYTCGKPFDEKDPVSPSGPYALSKWEAEQALSEVAGRSEMKIAVVRAPLVYGPGVKANFFRLIRWVEAGYPMPFGMIGNQRSMVYVGNLVDAIYYLSEREEGSYEVYMVSDLHDVSTRGLVKQIALAMKKKILLISLPVMVLEFLAAILGRKRDLDRLQQSLTVDCSKLCNIMGWSPPYSFSEAIERTVNWYRDS